MGRGSGFAIGDYGGGCRCGVEKGVVAGSCGWVALVCGDAGAGDWDCAIGESEPSGSVYLFSFDWVVYCAGVVVAGGVVDEGMAEEVVSWAGVGSDCGVDVVHDFS